MKFKFLFFALALILFSSCSNLTPNVAIVPDDVVIQGSVVDTFRFQIARGAIPGAEPVFVTGSNSAIGTTEETIWNVGGLYVWVKTAEFVNVVSSNNNDIAGGTGATTILLDGLDENYTRILEIVTLNGTAGVLTVNKYLRMNDALVTSAGSTEVNEGDIDMVHGGGSIMSRVSIGEGRDSQSIYTVPTNTTLFTGTFTSSSGKGDEAEITAWARPFSTGVQFLSSRTYGFQNTWEFENYNDFPFPEKTDFEVRARNTGTGGNVKVGHLLEFFQVPNSYLAKLDEHVLIK